MQPTQKIFRLEGAIQHYNWGGERFLPALLGKINTDHSPFAEYWMGAHENAPSLLELPDGTKQSLDEFIRIQNATVLGERVAEKFGRLPYLFKILDVKDMLSIQVHPSKKAAELEFAEESKKNIPLNASNRNYKDDNHKPELMVAWSDFWLLHGFKPAPELKKIIHAVPELLFIIPAWKRSGYEGVYKLVMEMDQAEVNKILQPLVDRILPLYETGQLKKSEENFWAARAYKTFCKEGYIDRGLFSVYLLNLVNLQSGEGIFQDAGILHAYLEGQNLELMANSDNVLRGGLTTKKVDVPELLKHVKFVPVDPAIITGKRNPASGEEIFQTPAEDFELRKVILAKGQALKLKSTTIDIFLVADGSVVATENDTILNLSKGQPMLAINGASLSIKAGEMGAVVFRATVPGE